MLSESKWSSWCQPSQKQVKPGGSKERVSVHYLLPGMATEEPASYQVNLTQIFLHGHLPPGVGSASKEGYSSLIILWPRIITANISTVLLILS